MSPSFLSAGRGLLQRKCACGGTPGSDGECAACKARRLGLQRRALGASAPAVSPSAAVAPPIVHEVLRSPGQPLDAAIRAYMEPHFGHDFSKVRVHSDARAAESARAVNALAYTVGRDVVFGEGQHRPGTAAGQRLLAHELTHVVQQFHGSAPQGDLALGRSDDPAERQADSASGLVLSGRNVRTDSFIQMPSSMQRSCGPSAIGAPSGCTGLEGDVHGRRFLFVVNCDDLSHDPVDWEMELRGYARTVAPGTTLTIHGFASADGPAEFNERLSCARAHKVRDILVSEGVSPSAITGLFMHGAAPGNARERRSVEVVETAAPSPLPLPIPPPSPALPTLKFWINAFIPDTFSGAFRAPAGPFAGRQVFRGPPAPFHFNSCFETDERGFTSALPTPSRLQAIVEFDTLSRRLLTGSGLAGGFTFEIDCSSGAVKCTSPVAPRGSGVGLVPPLLSGSSVFDIPIEAFASDPCVTGAPDIAIRGDIRIDVSARTFSFLVMSTLFPAIEMYMSVSGGTPRTLFRQPPPASSVLLLLIPGIAAHTGSGTF